MVVGLWDGRALCLKTSQCACGLYLNDYAAPHNIFGLVLATLFWEAWSWTTYIEHSADSAGASHILSLQSDGQVYASGANSYGQLGDGTTTERLTPVLVQTDVVSVAAGAHHSLFLKADGIVYASGWNVWGQLGSLCDCEPVEPECSVCLWDRPSEPTPVLVRSGIQGIAAGTAHSVFLTRGGEAYTVGWNIRGQLGDGTHTSRRYPVLVQSGVSRVAAGAAHTVFVLDDANGTVYATGANSNGQLGDGSSTDREVPVLVEKGVQSVVAGVAQTLFLKVDGTVRATG